MKKRPYECEAIVVRSIRYGEADRVLHLYARELGRVAAIAKGVRRGRSRRAGRLELLVRARMTLRRGSGELFTVGQVDTVRAHARLRESRAALLCGLELGETVARLLDAAEPNVAAYNLLGNALDLLDRAPERAGQAFSLAFRLKLMLAAGFCPELARCAECGEEAAVAGFSPASGGIVCERCASGSLPFGREEHEFAVAALTHRLAEAPTASDQALARIDRALAAMLERHAHVKLRRVA